MKKIFKLTAILLIAGAMMMTSCGKGNPDEEDDGLSGTWTKSVLYKDPSSTSPFTKNGSTYTFTKTDTASLDISSGRLTYWKADISESLFTGVKVVMSCSSKDAGHGIFLKQDNNNYYRILLREGAVLVEEIKNGDETTDLIYQKDDGITYYWSDWEDYINEEPAKNELVVYTTTTGAIAVMVNGTTITTIDNPSYTSFTVTAIGQVTYNDKVAGKPVTATYEFKKFQTKK